MKIFRFLFLFGFIAIVLAAFFLESNPGKKFVEKTLLEMLAKSGLDVKVGKVGGLLPYDIQLQDVSVNDSTADNVNIQISLIHLLRRELYISSIKADGVVFAPTSSEKSVEKKDLALGIFVHSFDIESGDLHIHGQAKLRRNGSGYIDADFRRSEFREARLDTTLSWSESGISDVSFDLNTPTLKVFAPWFVTEDEGTLNLQGWARGNLDHFNGKINGRFDATQMEIKELERNWLVRARIQKQRDGHVEFQRILASSTGLRFQGLVDLDKEYHFAKAEGEIRAELDDGVVFCSGKVEGQTVDVNIRSETLGANFKKVSAHVQGLWANGGFTGNVKGHGDFLGETWEVKTPIAYNDSWRFECIQIESPLLKAHGDLSMPERVGAFDIERSDLELLHKWNSAYAVSGTATGNISINGSQVYGTLTGKEIHYNAIRIPELTISREASTLQVTAIDVQYKNLVLNSASYVQVNNEFVFGTTGTLEYPLEFQSSGTLDGWNLTVNKLDGRLYNAPLSLVEPMHLRYSPEDISLSPTFFTYGAGSISLTGEKTGPVTDIKLALNSVPLDLLSHNPLEVPVSGKLNFDGTFHQTSFKTTGHVTSSIEKGKILIEGMQDPIALQGKMEVTLEDERLKSKTLVQVNGQPLLDLDFNIPFEMNHYTVFIPEDKMATGGLLLHGRAEDVLDFFNLGTNRIEGNIDCKLELNGKLNHPTITGACYISDGHYENYYTGTELTNISAKLVGQENYLILESLCASDPKRNGCLNGTGEIKISLSESCPFHLDFDFNSLKLVQVDLVEAVAEGHLTLDGTLKSALAKGNVEVTLSQIAIPDKIPRTLPDLAVVYKNGPRKYILPAPKKAPYPINLDIHVRAPQDIHIDGRGLHTLWTGNFHVGGTAAEPLMQGKLELESGDFTFSGKQFKLVDGSISMRGKPYDLPNIDISAVTQEAGIAITARIRGPINRPQITFQSNPPLQLSAILSYLLFGKDLSDVSGLQALQLAGTVARVAGEGPDILEMTRKSLGVDRLQIVMTPSSLNEGADTISLEVGKVIFPGFLVTIRQGAEDSAPDIGIQVDIGKGFTLGLESQQQPEQGRFSINWNLNY